jgi:hypothetical protein
VRDRWMQWAKPVHVSWTHHFGDWPDSLVPCSVLSYLGVWALQLRHVA